MKLEEFFLVFCFSQIILFWFFEINFLKILEGYADNFLTVRVPTRFCRHFCESYRMSFIPPIFLKFYNIQWRPLELPI